MTNPAHSFSATTCKNCGEKVEKRYCAHCGQENGHRIHLKHLLHDIPHAIFHVDKGFLYNVVQLFKQPGIAIHNYLEGRRKPFFHPVTYLAILLVINLMAVKITNLHYYDEQELLSMTAQEAAFIKEYDASQWWFLEHTYLYMLIAIPLCSVFCYFFFRLFKQKYNLAENAIIVMMILAQGVLIQSALYLLTGWVHNGVFIRSMEMVNLVLMVSYATYAFYKMINPSKKKWRALAGSFAGAVAILSLMLASAYFLLWISTGKL